MNIPPAPVADAGPPAVITLLAHEVRWQLIMALAHGDLRVQELAALAGKPLNLISYHLKLLRRQAVVREQRSSADGRDIYYSLDLDRLGQLYRLAGAQLHPALAGGDAPAWTPGDLRPALPAPAGRPGVLFLCTHNRARSQMAEGLLRHLGGGQVDVHSAGSEPGTVHPLAVQALGARGIDIGGQRSKPVAEFSGQHFDYVITVCDRMREQCPAFAGAPDCIHWSIADPIAAAERGPGAGQPAIFNATADELERRIRHFLATLAQDGRVSAA